MNKEISQIGENKMQIQYFNETFPKNDLEGTLAARVQFAQNQIIPSHPMEEDRQPVLTYFRDTLLLVQPLHPELKSPMHVQVLNKNGDILKELVFNAPLLYLLLYITYPGCRSEVCILYQKIIRIPPLIPALS